jgi:hypothetical protein
MHPKKEQKDFENEQLTRRDLLSNTAEKSVQMSKFAFLPALFTKLFGNQEEENTTLSTDNRSVPRSKIVDNKEE